MMYQVLAFEISLQTVSLTAVVTAPLSSTVVMWTVNKFLVDNIYNNKRFPIFMLILFVIIFLVSELVFNSILKFLNSTLTD